MKKNEKTLLILAAVVFGALVLVRGLPLIVDFFNSGEDQAALLQDRIERYAKLIEEGPFLKERLALKREQVKALEGMIFSGNEPNLVGTGVQRELRRVVDAAGVNVREMSVAKYTYLDGWLQIHQEMSFTIELSNVMKFLDLLEKSRPRLLVTEFSLDRNRRQYSGNITVVGFSKADFDNDTPN